jgi:hypothetical protein
LAEHRTSLGIEVCEQAGHEEVDAYGRGRVVVCQHRRTPFGTVPEIVVELTVVSPLQRKAAARPKVSRRRCVATDGIWRHFTLAIFIVCSSCAALLRVHYWQMLVKKGLELAESEC